MKQEEFITECTKHNLRIKDFNDRLFAYHVIQHETFEQEILAATYNPSRTPPESFGERK